MGRNFGRIGVQSAAQLAAQLAADLLDVIAPRDCLSCSAPGRTLCPRCAEVLRSSEPVFDDRHIDRPVAIGGWLEGPLGAAVRGYKSGAGRALAGPLAEILAGAIEQLVRQRSALECDTLEIELRHAPTYRLVAIPPSLRARWTRSEDVLARVVDAAVVRLDSRGLPVERVDWLEPMRLVHDQRGLDSRRRAFNVAESLRVRSSAVPALQQAARRAAPVIVVDDVLTTGATLREAIRALTQACPHVAILGATVVAATPSRGVSGRTSLQGGPRVG